MWHRDDRAAAMMRLPKIVVSMEDDDLEETVVFDTHSLTADPLLRAQAQRYISILFAYHDVLTELIKMAAPMTAGNIARERRMEDA